MALARLAERYGPLVLHWTRSDIETFIVQDDPTTYRYRTQAGTTSAGPVTETPTSPDAPAADPLSVPIPRL